MNYKVLLTKVKLITIFPQAFWQIFAIFADFLST